MAGPKALNPQVLALFANPARRAEAFAASAPATYARIPVVDWESYKKARARMGRDCGPGYRWVPDLPGVPSPESARDTLTEIRWGGILRGRVPEDGFPPATLQRRPQIARGFPGFNTPVPSLAARRKQYSRETVSTLSGLALLSALEPQTEANMRALVEALDQTAKQLEAAQPGWLSTAWQSFVGSEPAGAAVRTAAKAQRTLAETIAAKAVAIARSGDEAAARKLLRDSVDGRWTDVETTLRNAQYISAVGGAKEIGAGVLKDTGALAKEAGEGWTTVFKYAPYIVIGLAGIMVWRFATKAGEGAGAGISTAARDVATAARTAARNLTIPASSQPVSGLRRRRARRR